LTSRRNPARPTIFAHRAEITLDLKQETGVMSAPSRVRLDEFTIAMLATVMLGFLLPCRGTSAGIFGGLAAAAIGLLFFLQGTRLSRAAIIAGALHWRLHLVIFAATFVLFPVVGLALRPLSGTLLTPPLYLGLLFLCTLPSTVQDSVAFWRLERFRM
jgi:solute carrier family 10 (sodium/bile acid cotransporter), member 7